MRKKWGIPLKVAAGYAALTCLLAVAAAGLVRFVHASQVSEAGRLVSQRQRATGELVSRLLAAETAEHAVGLGRTGEWDGYAAAMDSAKAAAKALRALLADSSQRRRLDTLELLLESKRRNTEKLLAAFGGTGAEAVYRKRADGLRSGRDTLSVAVTAAAGGEVVERTVVVERTRRSFWGRLADAFRRPKADTVAVDERANPMAADSTETDVEVGKAVAEILSDIGAEAESMAAGRRRRIVSRGEALQAAGAELARRMSQLMESIDEEERRWLQEALAQEEESRREAVVRMGLLAGAAAVLAIVLLAGVWRDVAASYRYRRELEEAKRRAEELLRQRERLMLTVAHDIKAPAAGIAGYAALLTAGTGKDEEREWADRIRRSAAHLLRLVGALTDYRLLESGRLAVRRGTFRPQALLREMADGFRPLAEGKGLTLRLRTGAGTERACVGDAFRIRQIAENLLSNALKFTTEGSVTLSAEREGGMLRIHVEDTGPGMAGADRERIFQAFTRLPGAQGTEGVGLGLSIVRELVSLLGGTVEVQSAPGAGSRFTAALPVDEAPETASADTESAPQESEEPAPVRPLRVLLIDDDATQLRLTRVMLEQAGGGRWRTESCRHPDELFGLLRAGHFDVLLTDVEMPALGGFELLGKVRAEGGENARIPVVAVTAHSLLGPARFAEAGFAACLFKPFGRQELMEAIGRAVGRDAGGGSPEPPAPEGEFAALTAFAEGDEAAAQDILRQFREECVRHEEMCARVLDGKDAETAAFLGHKLLPTFRLIRSGAAESLEELERGKGAPWSERTGELCRKVRDELRRLVDRLPDRDAPRTGPGRGPLEADGPLS